MLPNLLIGKSRNVQSIERFGEACDPSKLLDFAQRQVPEENVWCLGPGNAWEVGGWQPNHWR